MKKLAIITLPLLTARSAFAGDFAQAYDASKGPSTLIAAGIAFAILVVSTIVFLWKSHFKGKMRCATAATIIVTAITLHAGDFANAADSGYGLNSRLSGFSRWFSSFWTSHFSWENATASFGKFTPVPSASPSCGDGRCSGNGASPPRQQN